MILGRIDRHGLPTLVSVHPDDSDGLCVDLQCAHQLLHGGPSAEYASMRSFIEGGEAGRDRAQALVARARGAGLTDCIEPIESVAWLVPVDPPSAFLCAGRNFGEHHRESSAGWKRAGVDIAELQFPIGFAKLPGTLLPANGKVTVPPSVRELDYEVEVAAVLEREAVDVPVESALDHVFGYTVFIDLSARDWQRREMKQQMLLLGKNFPGFGPLGPWIVTRDAAPDPTGLRLRLSVNGQIRQDGSSRDMIFSFAELISFWSQIGLRSGDLVASGTPAGVAMHMSDPRAAYLDAGDEVVATVDGIGSLRVRIG